MYLVVSVSNLAWAQSATTGAIAGVVKDTSGAVMPGVTVEAASPALIEKVRVAVTDDQGNYKITELRPGTYSVTFTLPGFSTYKREGIELTSGFTATVIGEMRVGALQETVTITAESPLVDVQNVRDEKVLSREVLDTLPTFKSTGGFMAVTLSSASPGTQDVGGNKGESVATMRIHGSLTGDLRWKLDGMNWTTVLGTGSTRTHRWNTVGVQEVVVEAGGTPENETGGAQLNYIPRDGGNRFSVYSFSNYTHSHLQGNNLTSALRARGLSSAPGVDKIWDYGIGLGGPILKDKLWFYQSNRWWGGSEIQPGQYYNRTVGSMVYTPDSSRPVISSNWAKDFAGRVTWQVAAQQKISFSDNVQRNCNCVSVGGANASAIVSPEASTNSDNFWNQVAQSTWSYPATNRLLFVAGMSYAHFPQNSHLVFGTTPQFIGVQDLGTGYLYNARSTLTTVTDYGENRRRDTINEQFSTSYVTGSHAFKTGVQLMQVLDNENSYIPNDLTYQLRNGAPSSIIEWASPLVHNTRVRSYALYAQDQWTIRNLTATYGLRFDAFRGYVLPLNLPPGQFVTALQCSGPTNPPCTQVQVPTGRFLAARNYPPVDNVPRFKDLSPRLGVAYDLFGNGKTAVKMSLNRYVAGLGVGTPQSVAPALAIVLSTTRTWRDDNGNFLPDCDVQNPTVNGECGAIANSAFGTPVVNTTYSSDTMTGLGNRANEWQTSAGIQHELRPGVAVNVTYYRTWFGNFTVTDNTGVTPANYDPYCITAPVDPRLPGGGGNQVCGLYDIQKVYFGKVSNLITKAEKFGKQIDHYNRASRSTTTTASMST
ncbi:MAG: hypothetical protein DMF92_09235 [Acidobacteria bacterium]|nr:MAG: hypothetical protein DMF92_09235 [Acidobacteriota bacterium]